MQLTEAGESRIRGYLFVLGRSLRSFLPAEVAEDALREVESHIRDRMDNLMLRVSDSPAIGQSDSRTSGRPDSRTPGPSDSDERVLVERVLTELGSPMRVAQAYSHEMTLDEAVTTGRFLPVARALWHLATTSVFGFGWLLLVFTGWTVGIAFLAMAVTKVVLPNNVGIFTLNGEFHSAGANLVLPPGVVAHPFGYWVVPVSVAIGLAILVGTHRASRRILAGIRSRRPRARLRLLVETPER